MAEVVISYQHPNGNAVRLVRQKVERWVHNKYHFALQGKGPDTEWRTFEIWGNKNKPNMTTINRYFFKAVRALEHVQIKEDKLMGQPYAYHKTTNAYGKYQHF